jgi:hypothetical protein
MFAKMLTLTIAIVLSGIAVPAAACSVLSLEAARKTSDVVVRGVGTFDFENRTGTIRTNQIEKGRRAVEYSIRWQPESVDGNECGEWFPLHETEQGRYFLLRNGDGTFSIIRHDHRPGIDK